MLDQKIVIARLGAAYGVKGWLHLISFTDPVENVFAYPNWFLRKKNQWEAIQIESYKAHGNSFVVKLANCDDRDIAALLKGVEIGIDRSELPETSNDEYYWSDLIGLSVITTAGETLGIVDYLFETGSNDIIVTKGKKQQFIPYIDDVIKSIDLEKQEIVVEWEPI